MKAYSFNGYRTPQAIRTIALEIESAARAQADTLGQMPIARPQGQQYTKGGHPVGRHANAPRIMVEPYFGAWDR